MKYMNHSKRVPSCTFVYFRVSVLCRWCWDGKLQWDQWESSAYAKITGVAHVVADWWHPVASQGSFTKPDFIGKDCSAVNFFWGRHSMNKLMLTTVCSECLLSYSTSLHTGICLAPQRSGLSHFHQEWSWLIMINPNKKTCFHNYSDLWTSCLCFFCFSRFWCDPD
jgi:hypothetical protein